MSNRHIRQHKLHSFVGFVIWQMAVLVFLVLWLVLILVLVLTGLSCFQVPTLHDIPWQQEVGCDSKPVTDIMLGSSAQIFTHACTAVDHSNSARRQVCVHLAEVDYLLTTVVVFVVKAIVGRLQPAVPQPSPGGNCWVRPKRVDWWEVAATRDVVLRHFERARPEVLEILDTMLSVCFRVVQLHRR